jgi:hypothetical protein
MLGMAVGDLRRELVGMLDSGGSPAVASAAAGTNGGSTHARVARPAPPPAKAAAGAKGKAKKK